jgi:hypothetical protein
MQPDNVGKVDVAPVLQVLLDERVEAGPWGPLPLGNIVLLRETFVDQILEGRRVCGEAGLELAAHLEVDIADFIFDQQPSAEFVAILVLDECPNASQELDHKAHFDGGSARAARRNGLDETRMMVGGDGVGAA